MGKIRNNKNVLKLRLLSSVNGKDGSSPSWTPVSNRKFTNDEKQEIRKLIGNVYFHDEINDVDFENKDMGSDLLIQKNEINKGLDNDIFKDDYFPDDGYDYEQHLCTINKSGNYVNSTSNNKIKQDSKSLLINSTSVLSNSEIDVNKDCFVSELVELANSLEEPDEFEELNDDFILDMTGLKNKCELDMNIDINDILWGGGKLQPDYKGGSKRFDNEFHLSESITENSDNSYISSKEKCDDESDENLLEILLDEYNDHIDKPEENINELCSAKSKNKLDILKYEHILDKYINQVKTKSLIKSKPEKSYDEINIPLDKFQVEKIISILENTEICENSSENTLSEISDFETIESVGNDLSQTNFEVINKPNKVDISNYYSNINFKNQTKCLTFTQQRKLYQNEDCHDDQNYIYDSKTSIATPLPLRRRDETSEDRRNRKQAVKQIKREMRDLKRKNKQDTKNLKKSVVGSLVNSNQNDIKSGVRYFRF